MTGEKQFIEALRGMAQHAAARSLADDAAVLVLGDRQIVLTCDTMVEGVHFLADDPAEDIGWKLAAVNLSDLAAKAARPLGCLMSYSLSGDEAWDAGFLAGLEAALSAHDMPLLGGDTVAAPAGAPRSFSLTALGEGGETVPSRAGAQDGDGLFVTGTIGDASLGLACAKAGRTDAPELLRAYRRPQPRLAEGRALGPHVHAMMDVSDGLLIDAERMAAASGLGVTIDLARIPLSVALVADAGSSREARLAAASAGDDYELLFAAPEGAVLPVAATQVGRFEGGIGLTVRDGGAVVPLPDKRGWLHGG